LIGEYNLIFALHSHFGFVKSMPHYSIPYRDLFHMGGPATVRGFEFGQIGPSIYQDSMGGQKAFWLNSELIIPLAPDMSTRVLLFYDGGAAWDTPNAQSIFDARLPLRNNSFKYRHSVGFGVQLTQPTPLRIYWGFKLDRNKRRGEKISKVHFSMAQDF
jgi:outer membrane protein insertion porin family